MPEIRVRGLEQRVPGDSRPGRSVRIVGESSAAVPITSEAASPRIAEVYVDWFDARGLAGWAWYPDAPDVAVPLEAVCGGQVIASGLANQLRTDLRDAGKGTGCYGFNIVFDSVKPGNEQIRVRVPGGAEFPLPLRHVQAPGPGTSSQLPLEGGVDYLNRRLAVGWVWRPSDPESPLAVEAILTGKVIGRTIADEMREDLLEWGKGTGRYGFTLHFDSMILGGEVPSIRVVPVPDELLRAPEVLPKLTPEERALTNNPGIEHLIAEHARFTNAGPDFEELDTTILGRMDASELPVKPLVFAYYLPQFHPIPENDQFWGTGFTEWRQLARAMPRFPGHYQPRIPRDLGFYSLTDPTALPRQAALAKAMGVGAFCYYYYWFNGRRVLERPLDAHMTSNIDMPFMIMWANENWTKTWDGSESSVLLRQDYLREDEDALLADLARHFHDPRYVRVGGRPLFFLYNPRHLPDAPETIARWRAELRDRHSVDPLIFMAQTFEMRDPLPYGLDGAVEFPPHKLSNAQPGRATPDAYSEDFTGRVIAYDDFVAASLGEEVTTDYPLIKTIVPSWDNDSRRPGRGLTLEGVSPAKYQSWLQGLIEQAIDYPVEGVPLVAVNAWNEWAEAAYLEPDVYFGAAFLNATARALTTAVNGYVAPRKRANSLGVSVILPCYNHARFLPERINSILRQSLQPAEIIFLDDASTDDSVAVARMLLKECPIPWRIKVNKTNSGNVFRQWLKGMALAQHELVWIAETDDSVDTGFLSKILPAFRRGDVMGAYGQIRCMDPEGTLRTDLDGYYAGLRFHSWNHSSTVPAARSFSHDFAICNIVPNVSGFVFRKPMMGKDEVARLMQYRFAGDWYFYALMLRGGALAYRRSAKSFFRVNPNSASRSAFFTDRHLEEHSMVLEDIAREYGLTEEALKEHAARLKAHFPDRSNDDLVRLLRPRKTERRQRVCIAAHSFAVGGGEIVPTELANKLKRLGHHVTYLVLENEVGDVSIRKRLRADIPVVLWDFVKDRFKEFFEYYDFDVFNSHNVSIEYKLFCEKIRIPCKYIASLHGGYETVGDLLTPDFIAFLDDQVDVWLSLADKNRRILEEAGLKNPDFRESFNAVPDVPVDWLGRTEVRIEHGIPEDAFVLVICSRAIEEKGWRTAIDVCVDLNTRRGRPVHLVLIGEGPALEAIRHDHGENPHLHFLGHVAMPIRMLRSFDMAIFPSTFFGETFPLFLIECLKAGLPIASSDIGEIPRIMGHDAGQLGGLVPFSQPGKAMVEALVEIIQPHISDPELHARACRHAERRSRHFSMANLARLYLDVFSGSEAAPGDSDRASDAQAAVHPSAHDQNLGGSGEN